MPSRELRESRRLTGPNVLWDRPGAVIDVALPDDEAEVVIGMWSAAVRELLDAIGWEEEPLTHRRFPGGVSLAISAPIDALYTATEVNEAAWDLTERDLAQAEPDDRTALAARLRAMLAEEVNPALMALRAAAAERGVTFLSDDDEVSVGLGRGSRRWAADALPAVSEVAWEVVHDVPIALVTGTNGKTTTVRLLAAIVEAAGLTPGVSSTDWIRVGDDTLDLGDWSGPGGARAVLRDRRVDVGLLETARGGMLRRGLAVTSADVAAILNVAEDHLGEWGVEDLSALVETKFVVARAARRLVLNADDPEIVERAAAIDTPVTWFGLDLDRSWRRRRLDGRDAALTLAGGEIRRFDEPDAPSGPALGSVAAIPITLGGAARHNLSNALAAAAVALELGLDPAAIRAGLESFRSAPSENPGRLNRFELGGAHVMVDFAHNPHGLQAVLDMAAALPAERRLVLIGQAGDRTDTSIRDLARIVWSAEPERIVIKEMPRYLRGRELGEVPRMITQELVAAGAPADAVGHADSELDGVRQALEWARPGDLLLVLTHESRDQVLDLCGRLSADGWRPGEPLPALD